MPDEAVPVSATRAFDQLDDDEGNHKTRAPSRVRSYGLVFAALVLIVGAMGLMAAFAKEGSELYDDDYRAGGWDADDDDDDMNSPINRLKAELHSLTGKDAASPTLDLVDSC